MKKVNSSLQKRAQVVAKAFFETDTENRGILLCLAGEILRNDSQGYTGKLLVRAGKEYGIPLSFADTLSRNRSGGSE